MKKKSGFVMLDLCQSITVRDLESSNHKFNLGVHITDLPSV